MDDYDRPERPGPDADASEIAEWMEDFGWALAEGVANVDDEDNSDDEHEVDPEDPRPTGHYPRFRDNDWHYIPEELAQTISLSPGGDGKEGQDWVLTYTPEKRD